MLVGNDHRTLIPTAAFGGAIMLVLSDTLARTVVSPAELPVGAVTAVAGAPVFIYLLRQDVRIEARGGASQKAKCKRQK